MLSCRNPACLGTGHHWITSRLCSCIVKLNGSRWWSVSRFLWPEMDILNWAENTEQQVTVFEFINILWGFNSVFYHWHISKDTRKNDEVKWWAQKTKRIKELDNSSDLLRVFFPLASQGKLGFISKMASTHPHKHTHTQDTHTGHSFEACEYAFFFFSKGN